VIYATVCRMTRSRVKVKVKVTQVRKLRKWPTSVYVLRLYACDQKTVVVNYGNIKFNRTDLRAIIFGVTWPSNLGCFTFGKILPLTSSRLAVPYGDRLFWIHQTYEVQLWWSLWNGSVIWWNKSGPLSRWTHIAYIITLALLRHNRFYK